MDALDFVRAVLLASTPWANDRAAANALLEQTLAWVGANAKPERVFAETDLHAWAAAQGYTRVLDVVPIVAVLRDVQPFVVAPSDLATRLNNLIAAYG